MMRISSLISCVALLLCARWTFAQDSTALHDAVAKGDIKAVAELLKKGGEASAKDGLGRTALHLAAANNRVEMCKLLISKGADLEAFSSKKKTPFITAVEKSATEAAMFLLDEGADIGALFPGNMTAVNLALHKRNIKLALRLIERGADTQRANDGRVSPMDVVLNRRYDDVFWPLFNSIYVDDSGRDAALKGYLHFSISVDNLVLFNTIQDGAPQILKSEESEDEYFIVAIEAGSDGLIDYLLEKGHSFAHTLPASGWTVLHIAARENNVQLITRILDSGIGVDVADLRGWTPLHVAAFLGRVEAVRKLVKSGATVDALAENGATPMHLCAERGKAETARVLLGFGASPASVTHEGDTPLDLALARGNDEMLSVFPVGSATGLDDETVYEGTMAKLSDLVSKGESVAFRGFLSTAHVDLDTPDSNGMTLLHHAADLGNSDIVSVLAEAGADVNAVDSGSGWTVLLFAVNGGHVEMAQSLMMLGADADIQGSRGWSPLHIASFQSNQAMVDALRVAGVREDAANENGEIAADVAGKRAEYFRAQQLISGSR